MRALIALLGLCLVPALARLEVRRRPATPAKRQSANAYVDPTYDWDAVSACSFPDVASTWTEGSTTVASPDLWSTLDMNQWLTATIQSCLPLVNAPDNNFIFGLGRLMVSPDEDVSCDLQACSFTNQNLQPTYVPFFVLADSRRYLTATRSLSTDPADILAFRQWYSLTALSEMQAFFASTSDGFSQASQLVSEQVSLFTSTFGALAPPFCVSRLLTLVSSSRSDVERQHVRLVEGNRWHRLSGS